MIRRFKDKEPFGRVLLTPTGPKMYLDDAAAARLNEVVSMLNRYEKMSVAGRVQRDADGNLYIEPEMPEFTAKITSTGPPYSWIEQTPGSVGGPYVDLVGGRQGTNAREYNGFPVPIGDLVEMELWPGGHERFVDDRQGEAGPGELTCNPCNLPLVNLQMAVTSGLFGECIGGETTIIVPAIFKPWPLKWTGTSPQTFLSTYHWHSLPCCFAANGTTRWHSFDFGCNSSGEIALFQSNTTFFGDECPDPDLNGAYQDVGDPPTHSTYTLGPSAGTSVRAAGHSCNPIDITFNGNLKGSFAYPFTAVVTEV